MTSSPFIIILQLLVGRYMTSGYDLPPLSDLINKSETPNTRICNQNRHEDGTHSAV